MITIDKKFIDDICGSLIPLDLKIIRLFAVAQIHYRDEIGNYACDRLNSIMGNLQATALFYLYGYSGASVQSSKWEKLLI